MAENLNLYQKLSKIRTMCEVMAKNKSGYGYRYSSIDEILARVTGGMKKYGISLIPMLPGNTHVDPLHYTKTKVTKTGEVIEEQVNEFLVSGEVVYRWIDDSDPETYIDIPWYMSGSQSDPSQAFGSGMTYSLRYFLLQYFQIATLDGTDPDEWRGKQKEAENAENAKISKEIIDRVHTIVMSYLEKNPDKRDDVAKIVKKYAKEKNKPSANYFVITDPIAASALLEEVTTKFGSEG